MIISLSLIVYLEFIQCSQLRCSFVIIFDAFISYSFGVYNIQLFEVDL